MGAFQITVDIDAAEALRVLGNGERRIGFALVNSLNATVHDVQKDERDHVRSIFSIRKPDFILREAAVIEFASMKRGVLEAKVSAGNQNNPKQRLLLPRFEEGGPRTGFVGRNVAIPLTGGARPTKDSPIDPALTFSAMKLQEFRGGKRITRRMRGRHTRGYGVFGEYGRLAPPITNYGGTSTWKGANRTYLIPGVGVYQRTGPRTSRLIWSFRPSVQLPRELRFVEIGRAVAEIQFAKHLRDQIYEAFDHALNLEEFISL